MAKHKVIPFKGMPGIADRPALLDWFVYGVCDKEELGYVVQAADADGAFERVAELTGKNIVRHRGKVYLSPYPDAGLLCVVPKDLADCLAEIYEGNALEGGVEVSILGGRPSAAGGNFTVGDLEVVTDGSDEDEEEEEDVEEEDE
jgi:hypothetical protein